MTIPEQDYIDFCTLEVFNFPQVFEHDNKQLNLSIKAVEKFMLLWYNTILR